MGPTLRCSSKGIPPTLCICCSRDSVKVTQASEGGREKILDILGPGRDLRGVRYARWAPPLGDGHHLRATELASISHRDFRNFVATRPEVLWKVLQALCERVRKTSTEMLELSSREVPYRLLAALHHLAEKYGQVAADGSCLISGKVGVQDLVAMVGFSTLSRGGRSWRAQRGVTHL